MKISFKHLIGGGVIGAVLLIAAFFSLPDGKLHLVFCDVGQGDAIYMRTPEGSDILFDGGPNDKVLTCLGRHMPFYDREIELVLLSHPQADHLNGLISVVERYSVSYFASNLDGLGGMGETKGQKSLRSLLKEKKILQKELFSGEKIGIDGVNLAVLWPERDDLSNLSNLTNSETVDRVNENSLVIRLRFGKFGALLTGDTTKEILDKIYNNYNDYKTIDMLKVPHHGSKFGLTKKILEWLKPKLAVISVGKNSYGHPTKEILGMLSGLGIKTLRTDLDGEIEIVSDGKEWELK